MRGLTEQAIVAHACHGHMYRPSPVLLSGTGNSSQVRSKCLTCTFRASCCSARLSREQVPTFTSSSVWDRILTSGQVRSGQVRSKYLTCSFRTSCCSARLSRSHAPTFAGSSVPLSGTGCSPQVRSGQVKVFNVLIQNKLL